MLRRALAAMVDQSCRYRGLPVLIVLMTIVALGIGTVILESVERYLLKASGESLTLAAAEVSDKIDRLLVERLGDIKMIARTFALKPSDRPYQAEYLRWMKATYAPVYLFLGVTDERGVMVLATDEAMVGRHYGNTAWFRETQARRATTVFDIGIYETDNGVESIAYAAPILDARGTFQGVVTTRISVPSIEAVTTRTIRSLQRRAVWFGTQVEYQMLTKDGRVFVDSDLAHKGNVNLRTMGLPSVAASLAVGPGFIEEEHLRRHVPVVTGYAVTTGYADAPGFGWVVLMRMDRDDILAPVHSILWTVGLAGAVVWCPLLALLLWSTMQLRREYSQARQESAWARAAEAALLQSQERNRAIVDTALDAVITIDSSGLITDWNLKAETMFGWTREEALGLALSDTIIPERDRAAHNRGIKNFLKTGQGPILNRRIETVARRLDGREFPVELAVSQARIGEEYCFSAFIRDITDRRRAEAALRESHQFMRQVIDIDPNLIFAKNREGRFTLVNQATADAYGTTVDGLIGKTDADFNSNAEQVDFFRKNDLEVMDSKIARFIPEEVITDAKGKVRWLQTVKRPIFDEQGRTDQVLGFSTDITERKRVERRLASQYAVTRVLSESANLEAAIPKIMRAMGESLEWELGLFWRMDKATGTLRCQDHWAAPTVQAEEFAAASRAQAFGPGVGLPGRILESGAPAWVRDVVQDANSPRTAAAAAAGLHGAFGFPIRIGGEVDGVIELFSRQVREPDDDLLQMVADIGLKIDQFGDRTRAEQALKQTEAQLHHSQKMEAVGRLAGGVAHDFNNLLTVIRGYSELILSRLAADDPSRREMEEIKKAADRSASLTGQLLAFTRRKFVSEKIVDLNALVTGMDGMLRRLIGEETIEICTSLADDLGPVKADPGQIEQIIMNLAVNARDAMPTGGRLTLETRNVTVHQERRRDALAMEPGEYVLLAVQDSGIGMDEEIQSHLFEPFFTTKEKGKGTGLGLSTVYGIVKRAGGTITVDTAPGHGTTFRIHFPRVTEAAASAQTADANVEPTGGRETILLVEDEPAVRGLVHEMLKTYGYTVLVARHGIEALLLTSKHVGPIHLMLTDVVMPQMTGPEVAEKLRVLRPDTRVLYMSGYPDHPAFAKGGITRDTPFLQKPFESSMLIRKVREVLDVRKAA